MYTLYYSPGAASVAAHVVLEEIGAPYKLELVDTSQNQHQSAAYLKLNPTGKVPALGLDTGDTISESAGICLFIADRDPQARLAPKVDDPQRGAFLQWLMYLTNTLQPADLRFYYSERYTSAAGDVTGVKQQSQVEIATCWTRIDTHLAEHGPYLLGDRFSAADIFCWMLSTWQDACPGLYERYPHIKKLADLVAARPSVAKVMAVN